jgi:hypothetical protein
LTAPLQLRMIHAQVNAMTDYLKTIITAQFEAALCMLHNCIRACPEAHWEGKIGNGTFRWVAYHTLFWLDFYLSTCDERDFELRDLHRHGGDEREPVACRGLDKAGTLEYVEICRKKLLEAMAAETAETLQAPCAVSIRKFSRGELHLYNLRHVQHHAGQLSAFLRRVDPSLADHRALPWVGSGWK